MGGYGVFIGVAYATVFLGLLYMTLRYTGMHKRLLKSMEDK